MTEFQNASSKLDAIVSNPEETTTNKAELLKIRESLVALASEASAGNEVIDGLAQNDKKTAQPTVKVRRFDKSCKCLHYFAKYCITAL